MNKARNYVACSNCNNWDLEYRLQEICKACNNTKQVPDPKEVLCNLCGESTRPLGTMNEKYPHGLENIFVMGGYSSYHLFDMTRYTFSLCEKCLRQLFIQFKIKPYIADVDYDDNITGEELWEIDQTAYEYRVWKDDGGHHQAYVDGKCNAVKNCPHRAIYTMLYIPSIFTEECCCEDHKDTRRYSNSKLTKFIPHTLKAFL